MSSSSTVPSGRSAVGFVGGAVCIGWGFGLDESRGGVVDGGFVGEVVGILGGCCCGLDETGSSCLVVGTGAYGLGTGAVGTVLCFL